MTNDESAIPFIIHHSSFIVPMRILFNGWFLVHHPHTGSGQYLQRLLEWLPRVAPEHDYHVLVPNRESTNLRIHESANLRICESTNHVSRITFHVSRITFHVSRITFHVSRCGFSQWAKLRFEQVSFPRACRELRADLAHVPYWAPPLASPVPLVVTIHDLIPLILPAYRGSLLARLYTALVSAAARGAQLVLTDSEASRTDIVARLGLAPEAVRTIHLAAGPAFQPEPADDDRDVRRRHGLPGDYVLYLGGKDRRKNLRQLLAAWTWVAPSVGELHPLVIAGELPRPDGRMFADLPALARQLDVADTVMFPGPIAPEDLPAVYRGAAVFVYPSRYEGFGLPPLEALACGVPVVAANTSSLPEVVGEAAYLVAPDDARALGAAILTVLVSEDVAESLRRRARAQAAKFSWEKTARETAEAYTFVSGGQGIRQRIG